jgi:ATP-dependent Lhr-like helicase
MLGDDLEAWLDESYLLKRTFRACATIAGLIEKRHPGKEKSGRQMTVSADLIYDVLRSHEPDHILLQATRATRAAVCSTSHDWATCSHESRAYRAQGPGDDSPLAVPVMLEIGKEPVHGDGASEALMAEAADDLIRDALGEDF